MEEEIVRCKLCGSEAGIAYLEIQEDDEGKYTFEKYYVKCCNDECDNWYLPDYELSYTKHDAIEVWNERNGLKGMTFEELIQLRGIEKPNYDSAGIPKGNYWAAYYEGWRDAYKDLKAVLEHNGFDMNQIVIPISEKETKDD